MIDQLLSTTLQVALFTLIPFLFYLFQQRTPRGFLHSIGLRPSTQHANRLALGVALVISLPILALTVLNSEFRAIMTDPRSVTGGIRQMGFGATTIGVIMITAVLKTALAEEIFFRGFLAKKLMAWLNPVIGNLVQAIIFGLIHVLLFLTISNNAVFLTIIFLFPAMGGFLMAHLNENMADGSIIPSWIAHAIANLLSYSVVGFLI
ncbi:MAG: CPBP family intramembrane glutamic endopeptidase [Chloroflexota bacterium]